ILNGLEKIPMALRTALISFKKNGGSIVVIPSNTIDLDSYNQFLANFHGTSLARKADRELEITSIAFSHPLYNQVFEKRTTNFQYPKVWGHYIVRTALPSILSFGNDMPFLVGSDG